MRRNSIGKIMAGVICSLMLCSCGTKDDHTEDVQRIGQEENEQIEKKTENVQEETGENIYTVTIKDQNGEGVSGCMVNFCDASSCVPVMKDEDGVYTFQGAAYAYHIQVVRVPEGYSYDTEQEYTAEENGGNIDITIIKE